MANIYDKSSLVLIPSGTKTGKVFSQKPVSGDGDFTFTRSSAATRVNADGNIEKETSNLLLYSNQPNQWSVVSVSLTAGQAGYDGSNDAWLFDSSAGYIRNNLSLSGVYTYSIYAKQGTADGIRLRMDGGTDANVYINLNDGSEFFSNTGIDYAATSVGSGWWRISITANDSSFSNFRVYAIDAGGSTTGTIYIQDAQVNQGLVAQPYQETIASAVYGGITDNVPRLDYTDSSCPALLLEPQRTNKESNSELLGTYSNSIIRLVNDTTSPEGLVNANKIVEAAATARHEIYSDPISFNGNLHTISFFAKADERRYMSAFIGGDPAYGGVTFDLQTGTISQTSGGTTADVVDYGNNWYRCSFTTNYPSSSQVYLCMRTADNNVDVQTYAGDGTSGFYIWGLQAEAGSYATSYIPTYGSSVTRIGETYFKTGASSIIGQAEGSVYLEITQNGLANYTQRILTLSDGTNNNVIGFQLAAANSITFYSIVGGVVSAVITKPSATTQGEKVKIAAAYAENDFVLYIDGVQVGTDNSGTNPSTSIIQNNRPTGGTPFIGEVHNLFLFKTRLSNEELAALTTI